MTRRLAPALAACAALVPAAAHACAVCGVGGDPNRASFFWTTVLLSLLPLGMLGGGLWFLARAARDRLADEFADPDAPRPAPAPRS